MSIKPINKRSSDCDLRQEEPLSKKSRIQIVSKLTSDQFLFENLLQKIYKDNPNVFVINKYSSEYCNKLALEQLEELRNLNFSNTLEDIFSFPENATSHGKIQHIINVIKDYTDKPVTNLIEDYKNFYYSNMLRFAQQLPGVSQFLSLEENRLLSDEEKVVRFREWIANPNNTANITQINLNNTFLAFLPLEINNLQNLQILNLNNNLLKVIPERLNLPNLQELHLENNQLKFFPSGLNLSNLRALYLNNNYIQKIPTDLNELIDLYLDDNEINEIPSDLNLNKLQILSIERNNINAISSTLRLPKLQDLILSDNDIKIFPLELITSKNLPHLQTLYLENNPIENKNEFTIYITHYTLIEFEI